MASRDPRTPLWRVESYREGAWFGYRLVDADDEVIADLGLVTDDAAARRLEVLLDRHAQLTAIGERLEAAALDVQDAARLLRTLTIPSAMG